MKFTKLFAAVVALMAVMTACQEPAESVTPNAGMEIAVSAQMYNFVRATDTAFEEGDQIGLHIVIPQGAYLNNAKYTFTEGALVADETNYWYESENVEADVLAYYPYNATATYKEGGYTFTVEADQSVEGGYAASDLLVASTTSKPTKETVALPFKHALSKVVININNELDEAVKSVMFADVYGSAVVDLKEGSAVVNGQKGIIKAAKVADKESYTLIIVPQTEATPRIIVTIEGDKQFVFNIEAAADFVAGKVATANIALTKELVGTEFSAEITDWVGDSELQFTPSEENTPEQGEPTEPENPEQPEQPEQPENPEGGEVVDPETPENPEGGEVVDPENPENPEGGEVVEPEQPEVFVPEATELGVVGSFAASGWESDAILYTTPVEGVLVAEGVEMVAYDAFKIRTAGTWEGTTNIGRNANTVNYIKANHYIAVENDGNSADITVEADGVYDIYFNQTNMVVYIMEAGADYTTAVEQTVNGVEPPVVEPEVTENVLYLKPNANWKEANARFAAYFFNAGGNTWVSMTDSDSDGIYEVNIPVGYVAGENVIFCRMNPATTANDWGNKWGQTADLVIPTDGKNLYTITDGSWDAGTWSTK